MDSRYADGPLFYGLEPKSKEYRLTVFRQWPSYVVSTYIYEVNEMDTIQGIATETLGNPELWWQIMDVNPELINPFELQPGVQLRIPRG